MWAYIERHGVEIGYPKQAVFAGEYQAGYREESRIPSLKEIAALEGLERALRQLIQKKDTRYYVLKEFYGAYPEPPEKDVRVKEAMIFIGSKRKFYRTLDQAHSYCEPLVDSSLEECVKHG